MSALRIQSDSKRLKSIIRTANDSIGFDEDMLELIEWMHKKYLASYLDIFIRLFLQVRHFVGEFLQIPGEQIGVHGHTEHVAALVPFRIGETLGVETLQIGGARIVGFGHQLGEVAEGFVGLLPYRSVNSSRSSSLYWCDALVKVLCRIWTVHSLTPLPRELRCYELDSAAFVCHDVGTSVA